VAQSRRADLNR